MKQVKEKCCGNCCWFYAEDTYGYGCCPFQFGEVGRCENKCVADEHFVSKDEMRHHRAVLLQYRRWNNSPCEINIYRPSLKDIDNAMKFASKYMKVFSNL